MLKQVFYPVFFLVLCFNFFSLAAAKDIAFLYNQSILSGENFSVSLTLLNFSIGVYDIKIDITNSTGGRISQIYDNGTWKSTFNYVLKAINLTEGNSKNFSLNITEAYNGTANITVRTRNNSGSSFDTFSGYLINVALATTSQNNTPQNQTSNNQTNESTQSTQQNINQTAPQSTQAAEASETIVLILPQNLSTGEIFNITVKLFNLKNKPYDLKVEMEKDNTLISDVYNPIEKDWQSSYYYILNFTLGSGNQFYNLTIAVKEKFLGINGNAILRVKLRSGSTQITAKSAEIELIKKQDAKLTSGNSNDSFEDSQFKSISGNAVKSNAIRLNSKKTEDIKSDSYISVKQFIKEYAVYGLIILCIGIIILLKND